MTTARWPPVRSAVSITPTTGILAAQLQPLQVRLTALLDAGGHSANEVTQRIRQLSMNRRSIEPRFFTEIAVAMMERRRIEIDAWNRGRDTLDTRIVSPQRLVHYRDNWYLDAWCHLRGALRSFSVDAIQDSFTTSSRRPPPRIIARPD